MMSTSSLQTITVVVCSWGLPLLCDSQAHFQILGGLLYYTGTPRRVECTSKSSFHVMCGTPTQNGRRAICSTTSAPISHSSQREDGRPTGDEAEKSGFSIFSWYRVYGYFSYLFSSLKSVLTLCIMDHTAKQSHIISSCIHEIE